MRTTLPIGITMGDAAGIGPELIVSLFAQGLDHPAVVYGDQGAIERAIRLRKLEHVLQVVADSPNEPHHEGTTHGTIVVRNRSLPLPDALPYGQISAAAGRGAYEYLCHSIDDAQAHKLRAIVTAPLNKEAMQAAGIDAPGHTEILAERTRTTDFAMMLANRELRVLLVTIHIALADVPKHINKHTVLRSIRLAHKACVQEGITQPRIAVAGLNPHAGENGRFGTEEQTAITPAIQAALKEGINASGPWPGDTIFMRARKGEYDIVVAQYHDQGLIPVKYLGVEQGVNVTVGLPFVRTSVDHGTAFDIAGKGIADASSLREAFDAALRMSAHQAQM